MNKPRSDSARKFYFTEKTCVTKLCVKLLYSSDVPPSCNKKSTTNKVAKHVHVLVPIHLTALLCCQNNLVSSAYEDVKTGD